MQISNKLIILGINNLNTLGLIRSLGEARQPVYLILWPSELRMCNLRFSKYITWMHHCKPGEDFIDVLKQHFWHEEHKPVLYTNCDLAQSMLDANYDELKERFHIFNAKGRQGEIIRLMDKKNTFVIAKDCGLNLIPTYYIDKTSPLPESIPYPCLIKSDNSSRAGKDFMCVCSDKAQLQAALRDGVEYLLQEYIEKDTELNILGVSLNHGKDVIISGAVRKIRDYLHYQSFYICLEDLDEYPQVDMARVKRFVAETGYEGLFSIEFLIKGDKAYFLEINLRNDGCCYLYTSAGVNYPYIWAEYCSGATLDSAVYSMKARTPTYLMRAVDIGNMLKRRVPFFKWWKQLFGVRAFFTFSVSDPKPFLYQCYMFWLMFYDKMLPSKHK